jgi:lysozyme
VTNQNLPKEVVIALRDFAFNVGGGAACKSTLVKLLNQNKIRDACNQFSRWVFVKGTFVKGLENRRVNGLFGMISERSMCLAGLK